MCKNACTHFVCVSCMSLQMTQPNKFTEIFDQLQTELDDLTDIFKMNLEGIDVPENLEYAESCITSMKEIRKLAQIAQRLSEAVDVLWVEAYNEDPDTSHLENGLREITLPVSAGMINQHLLSMTGSVKQKVVKVGEALEITLPNGTKFQTEIVSPGNRLRERGRVREFYESQGIRDGDMIILKELKLGSWEMRKWTESDRKLEQRVDLSEALKKDIP